MVNHPNLLNPTFPSNDPARAVRDTRTLLGFRAHWLVELPEPFALRLAVAGAPVPIVFANSSRLELEEQAVLASTIVYDRDELLALIRGVEADRLWHPQFLGFCFEKWRRPSFRVSLADALAGANPDPQQAGWSFERVLRRLQAQLECSTSITVSKALPHWSVAA